MADKEDDGHTVFLAKRCTNFRGAVIFNNQISPRCAGTDS